MNGQTAMTQPVIEKWITFHIDSDGKWDVAIFSGELAPGMRACGSISTF
jgi:hypothetical protein